LTRQVARYVSEAARMPGCNVYRPENEWLKVTKRIVLSNDATTVFQSKAQAESAERFAADMNPAAALGTQATSCQLEGFNRFATTPATSACRRCLMRTFPRRHRHVWR
jgi:hypothetical protein